MSVEAPASQNSPRKRPLPTDENSVNLMTPQRRTASLDNGNISTVSPLTSLSSHSGTPPMSSGPLRQVSEAPSTSTSVSGDVTGPTVAGKSAGDAPPKKRRKLTAEEKEQRRMEKEAKDRERAEQKVKREEEKRIKDEERRVKNEEKEAKNREKELEKQRKEEERLKKERSQSRLSTFFTRTSTAKPNLPVAPVTESSNQALSPAKPGKEGEDQPLEPVTPPKHEPSEYRKNFLPFQPASYTTLAPLSRPAQGFVDRTRKLEELNKVLGSETGDAIDLDVPNLKTQFSEFTSAPETHTLISMRDIIAQIQGTFTNPIDLTSVQDLATVQNPLHLLETIPVKHLKFHEDVRPPYSGTYTKVTSLRVLRKISRDPFLHVRGDTDYDYDSEAEWEEPEEGEDLDSEGEDDAESVGGPDEFEDLIDDEDNIDGVKGKRKLIHGDLEPLSTGLCWVDQDGRLTRPEKDEHSANLKEYRMGLLISRSTGSTSQEHTTHPINPFSTAYWDPTPAPSTSPDLQTLSNSAHATDAAMQPPRFPLQARPQSSINLPPSTTPASNALQTSNANPAKKPSAAKPPPKRLLGGDELAEFQSHVQGSTMTKKEILDMLKARFPKVAQAVLRDTLNECAARIGAREAEKRWVVL
ncbi:MAG: hypothetical protein Q9165_007529 [Trypethelium subeluteriae]